MSVLVRDDFAEVVEALVQEAHDQGIEVRFTSGFRSLEEQRRLVAKPGRYPVAAVGRSFHNYGLALDYATSPPDGVARVGQIAEALGLRWGGRFTPPDPIHIDAGNGFSIEQARTDFRADDLVEVEGD